MKGNKKTWIGILVAVLILAIVGGVLALCLCLPKKEEPPAPPPTDNNMSMSTAQKLVNTICYELGVITYEEYISKIQPSTEGESVSALSITDYEKDIEEDETLDLVSIIDTTEFIYCLSFAKAVVDNVHSADTYYHSQIENSKVKLLDGSEPTLPNNLYFRFNIKNKTLTIDAIPVTYTSAINQSYLMHMKMEYVTDETWNLEYLMFNTPNDWDHAVRPKTQNTDESSETEKPIEYNNIVPVGNVTCWTASGNDKRLQQVGYTKITAKTGAVEKTGDTVSDTSKVNIEMSYINLITKKKILALKGGADFAEDFPTTFSKGDALEQINAIYNKVATANVPAFKDMAPTSTNILQTPIDLYVDYFSK